MIPTVGDYSDGGGLKSDESHGLLSHSWRRQMDIATLLIQLISGAVGGNVAGGLLKNLSLGTLGNSIAGIVGGGIGGQILEQLFHTAVAGGAYDPMNILTQVLGGGVGGGILMAIVGAIRNAMAK
jgi:uncharacterized membrane protein YeaQ/YmgE (transglycosylase-associated protein family)